MISKLKAIDLAYTNQKDDVDSANYPNNDIDDSFENEIDNCADIYIQDDVENDKSNDNNNDIKSSLPNSNEHRSKLKMIEESYRIAISSRQVDNNDKMERNKARLSKRLQENKIKIINSTNFENEENNDINDTIISDGNQPKPTDSIKFKLKKIENAYNINEQQLYLEQEKGKLLSKERLQERLLNK